MIESVGVSGCCYECIVVFAMKYLDLFHSCSNLPKRASENVSKRSAVTSTTS